MDQTHQIFEELNHKMDLVLEGYGEMGRKFEDLFPHGDIRGHDPIYLYQIGIVSQKTHFGEPLKGDHAGSPPQSRKNRNVPCSSRCFLYFSHFSL